ncbi:MAG: class I SAM-dependent methyltransferase [Bacteroidota bacterium]
MQQNDLIPPVLARFYDVIYESIRHETDSNFYLKKIKEAGGPVLETGSGTGRFFRNALKTGADIYGIDVSENMLEVLKQNLAPEEHFRISCQDICTFSFQNKFKLIIAPFRVMMHVTKPYQQLQALNNVAKHLDEDGIFIFDTFVPSLSIMLNGLPPTVDFEGEYAPGCKLRRTSSAQADLVDQLTHIKMQFDWEENNQWHTDTWKTDLYFYFRTELEHLIERSDLVLEKFYGTFDETPLNKESKEFLLICKKRFT